MTKFNEMGLNDNIIKATDEMGFKEPTDIQVRVIPEILYNGNDVIGLAQTGTGKTAGYGLPLIHQVDLKEKHVQIVVLCPTRELCLQISKDLKSYSKYVKGFKTLAVYGGANIGTQISGLNSNPHVVVGTPGRTLDLIKRKKLKVNNIKKLVLDEADRMLEMGFIEDVEDIIKQCPKKRQTLFFSATFPPKVTSLAQKHLNNPSKVVAKKQVDPSKLAQYYYDVPKNQKFSLLLHLLKEETSKLVMVFCNTRKTVDFVTKNLRSQGVDATAIHGGFTQNKRTNTIDDFKGGNTNVLVCTDVAARGIHIDNVSHIYNYEIPKSPTDYVHRIGRTARAGEEGKVINLICDLDYDNFSAVVNEFRDFNIQKLEKPYVKMVSIKRTDDSRGSGHKGGRGNSRKGGKRQYSSRSRESSDERPRKSFGNKDSYGPRDNGLQFFDDKPRKRGSRKKPRSKR